MTEKMGPHHPPEKGRECPFGYRHVGGRQIGYRSGNSEIGN